MPNQAIHSLLPAETSRRAGFTLLEVMLALALSALLLGAVGVAVQIHLRAVETGRVEIEQAQIARAVLDRIADDLRGALQHTTVDTSQLKLMAAASAAIQGNAEALAEAAGFGASTTSGSGGSGTSGSNSGDSSRGSTTGGSSSGGSSASSGKSGSGSSKGSSGTSGTSGISTSKSGTTGGASSGAAGASPGGSSSGNSTGSADSASTTGDAGAPATVPGIYGSEYQIQVDVSRLPRPDEYGGLVTGAATNSSNAAAAGRAVPISVPHDVRTVTYYLNSQAQAASNLAGSTGGLMRRELHRSAALWGSQQGLDPNYDEHSTSLAPEVTALEFRYLDGTEWVSEWDTAANGCLPTAIEVAVTIGMPADPTANAASLTSPVGAGRQAASELVVRRVIFLPGAGQPSSTAASAASDASATGAEPTPSGSSSSSSN